MALSTPLFAQEGKFFPIDFDDFHTYSIFANVSTGEMPGSQAADVVRVTWLEDIGKVGQRKADTLRVSPGANALLMRDELLTGVEGGLMGPRTLNWSEAPDVSHQFTSFVRDGGQHSIGFLYGFRILEASEEHSANLTIIGEPMYANMRVDNRIVGPQAGIVWANSRGPLSVELQGLALFGYNAAQVTLNGEIGSDTLIPGALNRPLYVTHVVFAGQEDFHEFSPSGELRAETKLQVSPSVALRVAWSGVFVDNFFMAEGRVGGRFLDFGLLDPGDQQLFVQSVYCGMEMVR